MQPGDSAAIENLTLLKIDSESPHNLDLPENCTILEGSQNSINRWAYVVPTSAVEEGWQNQATNEAEKRYQQAIDNNVEVYIIPADNLSEVHRASGTTEQIRRSLRTSTLRFQYTLLSIAAVPCRWFVKHATLSIGLFTLLVTGVVAVSVQPLTEASVLAIITSLYASAIFFGSVVSNPVPSIISKNFKLHRSDVLTNRLSAGAEIVLNCRDNSLVFQSMPTPGQDQRNSVSYRFDLYDLGRSESRKMRIQYCLLDNNKKIIYDWKESPLAVEAPTDMILETGETKLIPVCVIEQTTLNQILDDRSGIGCNTPVCYLLMKIEPLGGNALLADYRTKPITVCDLQAAEGASRATN